MKARPTIQFTYLHYLVAIVSAVVVSLVLTGVTNTAEASGKEDGWVEEHQRFSLSAFITHDEIIDGTGLNSHMDRRGFDDSPSNGVIRTWDTISYPLRIVVNPKGTAALEDIELEITGTLDGGITDGRANARFSAGGTEDLENGTVTFKQNYTIERTGSAIMFPVAIEVLAAQHGVELTPEMQVQVVSVGGEDIRDDEVIVEFETLPTTTVTADVSIKPNVRRSLDALGIPSYPVQNFTGDPEDMQNIHMFTAAWGIANLPGVSNKKGATFPDPDGVIDFDIEMSGNVEWQTGPNKDKKTDLDFSKNKDTAFRLFDMRDNSSVRDTVGVKNLIAEGMPYTFEHIRVTYVPYSKMPDFDPETIEKYKNGNVWDSGDWSISKPNVSSDKVTYTGQNTDYVIGSTFPLYSGYTQMVDRPVPVAANLFSTQSFLVQMENEYYVGGGRMNPGNHSNIVNYNTKVTLKSYTGPDGNKVTFNKSMTTNFTETNSKMGTFSFFTDFASYPEGEQLGTYISNMGSLSKGDAYTLIGEDVQFRARLQSNVAFQGGAKLIYHWNTDAFRLTDDYAKIAERNILQAGYEAYSQQHIRNDKDAHDISYGVRKFKDNHFENLRRSNYDDFTWYDSFQEAQDAGKIGAIMNDITEPIGTARYPQVNIPLRVLHDNIGTGSTSSDDPRDANIATLSAYGYMDKARDIEVGISDNVTMGHPAEWDELGEMLQIQSPIRGFSNFETLAIIPAEVSTELSIDSDKAIFYSTDKVDWKSESRIVLPGGKLPADADSGVTLHHELPDGLDYIPGTGEIDGEPAEPELWQADDGNLQLRWDLMISNEDVSIPDVSFDTQINNSALDGKSSGDATIKSVIESDLDNRPEKFRSSSATAPIRPIGVLEVGESVKPLQGPKNSTYRLEIKPSTSIEDEHNIVGVKTLPYMGEPHTADVEDTSIVNKPTNFSGTLELTRFNKHINTEASVKNKDVRLFVNRSVIHTDDPYGIDFTKNGWSEYSRGDSLAGVKTVGFKIDGVFTAEDSNNITIQIDLKTNGNEFGDFYLNRTIMNSDRQYGQEDSAIPPISGVGYSIVPDLELRLDRFQIFTNKESVGLPSFTRVHQIIGAHLRTDSDPQGRNGVKDLEMTLGIYDTDTGEKVAQQKYKQPDIKNENNILINTDAVDKGDVSNYEVRIENYDTDRVWVRNGNGAINTDGHTSTEGTLGADDINDDGVIEFSGVTMTERERGKDMVTFNENLTVDPFDAVETKSGYGFEMNAGVSYTNPLMNRIESVVDNVVFETDTQAVMDRNLIDESLPFYDESKDSNAVPMIELLPDNPEMEDLPEASANTIAKGYELPEIFMAKNSGLTYTDAQVNASDTLNRSDMLEGGNQLFVPVWINNLGVYDSAFKSNTALGSHFMNFNVVSPVDVNAYMLHHIDSETGDADELLLKPVERDELPDFWNTEVED